MNTDLEDQKSRNSQRDLFKASLMVAATLAASTLTVTAATARYGGGNTNTPLALTNFYPTHFATQRYTYIEQLPLLDPATPLEANEMRITFMGSGFPMARRAQAEMSVFVEVGCDADGWPLDQFVFDLGCGASANYQSVGIDYARMNKIFINHLHPDHLSDLIHAYCFGDGGDRKSPLYIWGNCNSGVTNPGTYPPISVSNVQVQSYSNSPRYYNDGVSNTCYHLREACRWATESFAFQTSADPGYFAPAQVQTNWGLPVLPLPVGDDPYQDANALVPIELDWTKKGDIDPATGKPDNIAYDNWSTKARVTHFPVIHTRKGSMGYRLDWTPPGATKPLTMIYTSDTKPETNSVFQACNGGNGVNVFVHEMILAADALTMKAAGLAAPPPPGSANYAAFQAGVASTQTVEDSSHTPQGAFGYLLSQISPRPKLTVATHFPVSDDTVATALKSVQAHCPDIKKVGDQLVWSFDLMVLRVFPDRVQQCRALVNEFTFSAPASVLYTNLYAPKYHTTSGAEDPLAQLDLSTWIQPTNSDGTINYRTDGW
jgi:ribonuclease Z